MRPIRRCPVEAGIERPTLAQVADSGVRIAADDGRVARFFANPERASAVLFSIGGIGVCIARIVSFGAYLILR
jgi:hypothetical protein